MSFKLPPQDHPARAMRNHAPAAESKYLDQVNDAATVLAWRNGR